LRTGGFSFLQHPFLFSRATLLLFGADVLGDRWLLFCFIRSSKKAFPHSFQPSLFRCGRDGSGLTLTLVHGRLP
jgi:hypothetical protein